MKKTATMITNPAEGKSKRVEIIRRGTAKNGMVGWNRVRVITTGSVYWTPEPLVED